MIGQTIAHYQIKERLGGGGMGVVYLAKDTRLEREVAIKFLPPDYFGDRVAEKRFQREAKAAAALSHPHICVVHDVGDHESQPYIIMERLEGETLKQRLQKGSLDIGEALKLATQISAALQAAHTKGIIHRDVKPANIFITKEGYAKVLDFGLAKRLNSKKEAEEDLSSALTRAGATLGTLAYMSPEQLRGKELDARTDTFSFGVVLYEMVTGVHPFRRSSVTDTSNAIINDDPQPLARFVNGAPEALQHILRKMLAKSPERRHGSIRGLQNDLEQLVEDSGRSKIAEGDRRSDWHWKSMLLILLGVVVLLAAGLYSLYPGASDEGVSPTIYRPVPLTTYPGIERQPTFSPDGSQVAFVWNGDRQNNFDIYVKVVGSDPPLRLTSHPTTDFGPAWSPDGQQIAFLRSEGRGRLELLLVSPLGGTESKVLEFEAKGNLPSVAWSPDGTKLAFPEDKDGSGVSILSLETGLKTQLTASPPGEQDLSPVFSADGEVVYFRRANDLYSVSVQGGEVEQVIAGNVEGSLAVTANGNDIVSGEGTFQRVPLSSGKVNLLEGFGGHDLAISRRGDRLAFASITGTANIWKTSLATGDIESPPQRLIASTIVDTNPQFSRDGQRIVFTSGRTGAYEIWVCDSDGTNLLRLTSLGECGSPRFSPDGNWIAFDHVSSASQSSQTRTVGSITSRSHIWVVGASGGTPQQLTEGEFDATTPSWSDDGEWIYYSSNQTGERRIWKTEFRADGIRVEPERVTTGTGHRPIESPDGRYVFFFRTASSQEDPYRQSIWRVPVEGGREEQLGAFVTYYHLWDVSEKSLYFVDWPQVTYGYWRDFMLFAPQVEWSVLAFSFADGSLSKVGEILNRPQAGPSFGVSFDGRWLLTAERDEEASDLMLVENFR